MLYMVWALGKIALEPKQLHHKHRKNERGERSTKIRKATLFDEAHALNFKVLIL